MTPINVKARLGNVKARLGNIGARLVFIKNKALKYESQKVFFKSWQAKQIQMHLADFYNN